MYPFKHNEQSPGTVSVSLLSALHHGRIKIFAELACSYPKRKSTAQVFKGSYVACSYHNTSEHKQITKPLLILHVLLWWIAM